MSRVLIDTNSIRICGANFGYLLRITLFTVPVSLLSMFAFSGYALFEPFSILSLVLWFAIACFLGLIVLMPMACWHAFSACTAIDRVLQIVTVTKRKETNIYDLGEFEKILMQPVRIPRSGVQYHAYLIGAKDRCHLEIAASSKSGLQKKLQPIAEFLVLPIEETTNVETYGSVLISKRRVSKTP